MAIAVAIPPTVADLIQKGLIERAFHDALVPNLQYRAEAFVEEWPEHAGEQLVMTRSGLLPTITEPLTPGVDPIPQAPLNEQWIANLVRFAGADDVSTPTSAVAAQNLFLQKIAVQGVQSGMSVNQIARNAYFKSYLSGQTLTTAAALAGATTITVAAINGFTTSLTLTLSALPQNVSPVTPQAVTIAGVANTVIGAFPADPSDPFGPGTLLLGTPLVAPIAARAVVLADDRPLVLRAGGGDSVDAIAAGDILTLQDLINAVNLLRQNNVQPHEDGFYHAHIMPVGNSQLFADPAVQRLNTSLPEFAIYKEAFIGTLAGFMASLNTESPTRFNSGPLTATGVNARYARGIGGEVVNDGGINVGRVLVTGRAGLYEKWLPGTAYVTEAGITGKLGAFDVINNGVRLNTERIDLILRAPINRLQDQVGIAWQITTSFSTPSDKSNGGPQRFKRGVIVEHAA